MEALDVVDCVNEQCDAKLVEPLEMLSRTHPRFANKENFLFGSGQGYCSPLVFVMEYMPIVIIASRA